MQPRRLPFVRLIVERASVGGRVVAFRGSMAGGPLGDEEPSPGLCTFKEINNHPTAARRLSGGKLTSVKRRDEREQGRLVGDDDHDWNVGGSPP